VFEAKSINLFSIIAIIIFIIAVGGGVAVFISKQLLVTNINSLNKTLIETKDSFEPSTIDDLKRKSARLSEAKSLLDNHFSFSAFFRFMEKNTYQNVVFKDFTYVLQEDGNRPKITVKGQAKDFNSLALQSDLLMKSKELSDITFLEINPDKVGNILFSFSAMVDPSFVLYKYRDPIISSSSPKVLETIPTSPTSL